MNNSRAVVFVLLIFFIFSCASGPVTYGLLDWDSSRFAEKDGRLFNAVKSGDPDRVRAALADNPNINVSDRLRQTAFMWACRNGSLNIINLLLDHDAVNIDKKTRNYKRLDIKAESSPRSPELKYNALFCYVMSNGINPYNQEARDTLKRIIDKDPSILDMTDYYGETVIHKLIRSGNNYFDVIITENNTKTERAKQELLNKPSRRHSPLSLAVETGNRIMVEALVNAAEKGMAINDFSNDDLPVLAFDNGNGDLEIFLNFFKGKIWDDKNKGVQPRPNDKFVEAYSHLSNVNRAHSRKVSWFIQIYNKYKDGIAVNDPNLLDSEEYTAAMTEIFNMARNRMSDERKRDFFDRLGVFPHAVHLRDMDNVEKKSLIQYIVEIQSVDVLERVLQLVTPDKLPPVSNGYGDYLTIAMLGRKTEIMHFLLDRYPDFQIGINNLMKPGTIIEAKYCENAFGLSLMDPLQVFCLSSLSDDRALLVKMARFYQPRFYDKTYRGNLLSQLADKRKYDIFEFFLDYDESFYDIDYIAVNEKPVLEVLFGGQEGLARKIVNYYIRTGKQLDVLNEGALRSGDPELWESYQSSRTTVQSNVSGRSGPAA